jgi:hypothetical protein
MLRPAPNQTRYTPNRTRQSAAILTGAFTVIAIAFTTHAAFTPDDPSSHPATNVVQQKVTTPGYDARTDSLNPILMEAARKLQQQRDDRHPQLCRPLHRTHYC